LSVDKLAEVASLSPRQFSRAFKRRREQSPAKAVEKLRLEAARLMIEQSHHPIDVVARETGFVDRRRMREHFYEISVSLASYPAQTPVPRLPSKTPKLFSVNLVGLPMINTSVLPYHGDGLRMVGYFAIDDANSGSRPAVLVAPEAPGLE